MEQSKNRTFCFGRSCASVRWRRLCTPALRELRSGTGAFNEHLYRYSIVESPLPVADYVAEIRVHQNEEGTGSTIEWSSEFKPKDASVQKATEVIQGIYQTGFDNLKKLFGT